MLCIDNRGCIMKNITKIMSLALIAILLVSCRGNVAGGTTTSISDLSENEIKTSSNTDTNGSTSTSTSSAPAENLMTYTSYSVETYIKSLYTGNVVYNETAMVLQNNDGSFDDVTLMYNIEKIYAVYDFRLMVKYEEGSDYVVKNGKLSFPKSSRIMNFKKNELYPSTSQPQLDNPGRGTVDGLGDTPYVYFQGGSFMSEHQIAVTYRHTDAWKGETVKYKGNLIPKTAAKLKANQPVKMFALGDSITAGSDSSAATGILPKSPGYVLMAENALKNVYNYNLTYKNLGAGGTNSEGALSRAYAEIVGQNPDLVTIAYGMNDFRNSTETFTSNIKKTIELIRTTHPDCEFLLISTMHPNPKCNLFAYNGNPDNNYIRFEKALLNLESSMTGVAVVPVTSMHNSLMTRKKYEDATGSNYNHPNDFMMRVYCQAVLDTMLENRK